MFNSQSRFQHIMFDYRFQVREQYPELAANLNSNQQQIWNHKCVYFSGNHLLPCAVNKCCNGCPDFKAKEIKYDLIIYDTAIFDSVLDENLITKSLTFEEGFIDD